jgi:indolepyruvate ferredoxin oxidoreductase
MNQRAFALGRWAAHDRPGVEAAAGLQPKLGPAHTPACPSLDSFVADRAVDLTAYQDAAYADRYRALVDRVRRREADLTQGKAGLAEAVAHNYHKLLAYKDEYEVARLYTEGSFEKHLRKAFQDHEKIRFHLAPPLIAERDPDTGHLKKQSYGPWILPVFRVLARLKFLRGSRLDIFGRTAERRLERQLIADYEIIIDEVTEGLGEDNHALAMDIARTPEGIRGFGHVKERNIASAKAREAELLTRWRSPGRQPVGEAAAAE